MSEFECANGHLVKPSLVRCPVCGGPIVRMDGHTSREWQAIEDAEQEVENERKGS